MYLLAVLLSVLLDDRPRDGSGYQIGPPNIAMVALRVPFLKTGMTEPEARKVIDLDNCGFAPEFGGGIHHHFLGFPVRPGYHCYLNFAFDAKRDTYVLMEWSLDKQ